MAEGWFTEQAATIREICNGILFLSAILLVAVWVDYAFNYRKQHPRKWWRDDAVQGAGILALLMLGHAMRAGSSWMEFLYADIGWNNSFFANSIEIFIAATSIILVAKLLIAYKFTRYGWRWFALGGLFLLSVGIPVAIKYWLVPVLEVR